MSEDLARRLEEQGHPELAAQLQRKRLADELRSADQGDLADALEQRQVEQPAVEQPAVEQPAVEQEIGNETDAAGEAFLAELREKSEAGWVSIPGLLG